MPRKTYKTEEIVGINCIFTKAYTKPYQNGLLSVRARKNKGTTGNRMVPVAFMELVDEFESPTC